MNNISNNEYITTAVQKFSDTLIRIAFNYTRNMCDSEDILQDVFMSLLKVPSINCEAHLKAWLIRVTINKSKNAVKAARKKRTLPLEMAKNCFTQKAESVLDQLQTLPPKDRIIIYLFYWENYNAKEIGDLLHKKEKAVLMRLSRARAKLKTILQHKELQN